MLQIVCQTFINQPARGRLTMITFAAYGGSREAGRVYVCLSLQLCWLVISCIGMMQLLGMTIAMSRSPVAPTVLSLYRDLVSGSFRFALCGAAGRAGSACLTLLIRVEADYIFESVAAGQMEIITIPSLRLLLGG